MDENIFWLRVWQTCAVALVALVASIGGCTSYQTHTINEMTKAGADPMRAACSIKDDRGGVCAVLAATK